MRTKYGFDLLLYVPVDIYSHVGTVNSHNRTFFLGKPDQVVNQYFVHIHVLSLVTDNNPSRFSGREENDRRNHFMINHHESMGPDRDRSLDLKSDTHLQPDTLPTALRGPAHLKTEVRNEKSVDYLQRIVKIWDFGR